MVMSAYNAGTTRKTGKGSKGAGKSDAKKSSEAETPTKRILSEVIQNKNPVKKEKVGSFLKEMVGEKGNSKEDQLQVERACFLQCGLANRETKVYSDSESETTETDPSPDNFRESISDQSTDTDDLESDNGAMETVSAPDTSESSHFDQSTDTDDLIMYDNNGYIYTSTTSLSSELSNGSPASLDLHSSDNNKTVKPVVPVMSDASTSSSNNTHVPNEGYQSLEVR